MDNPIGNKLKFFAPSEELKANKDTSPSLKTCKEAFKQKDENQISAFLYSTHTSLNLEHWTTPTEGSPNYRNAISKKSLNLSESGLKSINPNDVDKSSALPDHNLHSFVQPALHNYNEMSAGAGGCSVTNKPLLDSKGGSLEQVVADGRVRSLWLKLSDDCVSPVEQEQASDVETFFSIQSGSYSRSSSPFSLDDNTDAESCIYEDAFEYPPTSLLLKQMHLHEPLSASTSAGQQPVTLPPSSVPGTKSRHLREASCNTDLSIFSCHDKNTQTTRIDVQDVGANTDISYTGIASPTRDVENVGADPYKFYPSKSEALLRRAVKAEMQLVDVQRWMCWQLCWKTQQQLMEKQPMLSMYPPSGEHSSPETTFNLSSALNEVEEKYLEMKTQIQSGVPLDDLVPLSMQLAEIETPPGNLLKECFSVNFQSSTTDKVLKAQGDVPKAELPENNVAANDKSEERECDQSYASQEDASYVHVGNIDPSVKEEELRAAFRKFEISQLFIEESSMTTSYALLIFTCPEQAKAAVKEMNGKLFCGKKLKVRHIQQSILEFQFSKDSYKPFSAPLWQEKMKVEPEITKVASSPGPTETVNFLPKLVAKKDVLKVPSRDQYGDLSSNLPNTPFLNEFPAFSELVAKKDVPKVPSRDQCADLSSNLPNTHKPFSAPLWPEKMKVEPEITKVASSPGPTETANFLPKLVAKKDVPKVPSREQCGDMSSNLPNTPFLNEYPAFSELVAKKDVPKVPSRDQYGDLSSNLQNTQFLNEYPAFSEVPSCSSYGAAAFSSCIPPAYPWVMQSYHSSFSPYQIQYQMFVPCPYPLYTSPGASPFTGKTSERPLYKPNIKMSSNDTLLNKGKCCEDLPPSKNSSRPEYTSTGVLNKYANVVTSPTEKDSPKTVISASSKEIETPCCTNLQTSSALLNNETAGIKKSSPVDDLKTGSSGFKPTEPLRFPLFVPKSVTMPEGCKAVISIKPDPADGVSQPSTIQTQNGKSSTSQEIKWGVYPKLDQTSEFPTIIIPNRLSLSQFKKVVNYLCMCHTQATRDEVVDALQEVRLHRGGSLGGLTIPNIISQVSSLLTEKLNPPA